MIKTPPPKMFTAIVARRVSDSAIGAGGNIPWNVPEDMKFFYDTTTRTSHKSPHTPQFNVCIMGRKTYESIPKGYLPGRNLYVLTSGDVSKYPPHPLVKFFSREEKLLEELSGAACENVFICGGQRVYERFLPLCTYIRVTDIFLNPGPADAFFPSDLFEGFDRVDEQPVSLSGSTAYRFLTYRKRHPEWVYMDVAGRILREGAQKLDRTFTGTLSVFGPQIEFDLREGFPLLTTKRVFWNGVLRELFWFISGSTDSKILSAEGVKIWEGNTSRSFLDSRNLDYEEGDIGPGYGFQWRHWGAEYRGWSGDYDGEGIDQLSNVIDGIKSDPYGRRHIVSAWNVEAIDRMALPPCHLLFQFYAVDEIHLDIKVYQRSGDWFLGVPFNIASYALLLTLAAKLVGRVARNLILTFGDAHVYSNHVEQLRLQLTRPPQPLPRVTILDRTQKKWEDFLITDIQLHGYKPLSALKASMAV